MKTFVYSLLLINLYIHVSCNAEEKDCNDTHVVYLAASNVRFRLPEYIISDTTKWGGKAKLFYEIKTKDSAVLIFAIVKKMDVNLQGKTFEGQRKFVKDNIESRINGNLVEDRSIMMDNVKVWHLKYHETSKHRLYSNIFFIRDSVYTSIDVLETLTDKYDKKSYKGVSDCVLKSLSFQ
jgi:hypothetical protein